MALELKGNAQKNIEVSVDSLPCKGFPGKLQFNENSTERLSEHKNVIEGQQDEDAVRSTTPLGSKLFEPFNGYGYHTKAAYYQGHHLPFYSEPQKLQSFLLNSLERRSYPFYPDNGYIYAVPFNGYAQDTLHKDPFQDFQYFVVIDFEATCDKEKHPHPQEIIEFPSVIVSSVTGKLEACFQTYVRPTCNQILSDFCKDLTGIQQIQVDRGVTLSEALLCHDKWLENKGIKNTNFTVVTWSNWDCRVMLESECRYKKIRKPPYFDRWINLKVPFHEVFGGVRCNLKEAVEMAGLVWHGRAHCGLDDAKNTARLLGFLMHKGIRFSITNSMTWQESDHIPAWNNHSPMQVPHFALQGPKYHHPYCYCGVRSSKGLVRKPGLKQGSFFYGCGNWTAARGACCQYFEWTS